MSVDLLFEKYIKEAGLYGKAFFGHKASRQDKKKIKSLWTRAVREDTERKEFLKNLGKAETKEVQESTKEV